jgi:hypothetical protein
MLKLTTRAGHIVTLHETVLKNSCGDLVTFPLKGSIKKPNCRSRYQIWTLEGLEAVDLLTHDKKQLDYPAYIDRICESGNRWAILVKLADQKDNLDPARWLLLGKHRARALTKRYAGVVPKLEEALENAAA